MLSRGLAGILGWPLERTLSPALHNAALRRAGLDWVYLPLPVAPEALGDAVRGLRALGARGLNVTMPHKETVMPHLDEVTGDAVVCGAVNTIENRGGRLVGHNTDVEGFVRLVEGDAGLDLGGLDALVLGAGGAARAVVLALGRLGTSRVRAAARRPVQDDGGIGCEVVPWKDLGDAVMGADVIVNCTPLGSEGTDPLAGCDIESRHVVLDIVYDPPRTPLIARAQAAGAVAHGGLGMLVHQAAASFRIWTQTEPEIEAMSAAAVRAIGASVTQR